MTTRLWHVPVRVATGAYILNSGLSKQGVDDQHAAQLQGMAATAFPLLADMPAQQFVSILATAETALGAALLAIPVVPPLLAGLGLLGFAAALNRVYLKAPGLRQDGTLKPTQQGIGIAQGQLDDRDRRRPGPGLAHPETATLTRRSGC
jgi:hypothetical protein